MMQMRRITRIKKYFGEIRLLRAFRIKNLRLCTAMLLFFCACLAHTSVYQGEFCVSHSNTYLLMLRSRGDPPHP